MEKKIESYNASYPAAFYEIGTVYSFYGQKSTKGEPAKQEYINRYASVLKNLEEQQRSDAIQPVKNGSSAPSSGKGDLTRYYAVVVAKSTTYIEIMFLNDDNGNESYLTKKYAVGKSVPTLKKDLMPPAIKTEIPDVQGGTSKVGGITRSQDTDGSGKVGGITKVGQSPAASTNIGGVTLMNS